MNCLNSSSESSAKQHCTKDLVMGPQHSLAFQIGYKYFCEHFGFIVTMATPYVVTLATPYVVTLAVQEVGDDLL